MSSRTLTSVNALVSVLIISLALLIGSPFVARAQEDAPVVDSPVIVEEIVVAQEVVTETDEVVTEDTAATDETAPAEETTDETPATVEETPVVEETTSTETESQTASAAASVTAPELSTDKSDYHPGEIVTVFGRFFSPLKNFIVRVFGNSEVGDFWSDVSTSVTSDESGAFTFTLPLDNFYRPLYMMSATDVESGEVVASGQFTDAPNASVDTFDQCANDDGDGYSGNPGSCNWTNGNLNGNNSTYSEEDATVQRLLLKGLANGSHTVTIEYDTTKGGKHAYDFLTDPKLTETWITTSDFCSGLTAFPSCSSAAVNFSGNIPADPLNTSGTDASNQNIEIRNGTITSISAPQLISGSYAGDSTTRVNVTFSVNTATCLDGSGSGGNAECPALLTWGAHISSQADWGSNSSAVNISGSPYHVRVTALDGKSTGNRDNQMAASAIPSTITIRKVVAGGSSQTFSFTTTGNGYAGFNLVSGGSNSQSVDSGNYTVTEDAVAGWAVTNIQCTTIVGTGTTAVPNIANRSIAITLGTNGGNVVDCTYTNELQQAHLTLLKDVVNDNGGSALDTTWTLSATGPTNISGIEGNAAVTNAAVNAGTYALSESGGPSGYSASQYSCVKNGGAPVVSNSIVLAAGDNATCTITNNDNAPSLTLVKDVINDNGGTAVASDWTLTAAGYDAQSPDIGTYALSESVGPAGYAQTSLTCSNAQGQVTSVTLGLGEAVVCTFVNDDIAPELTVIKHVVNDNGGTAVASDFSMIVNAQNTNPNGQFPGSETGTVVTLNAGLYGVAESNQPGYMPSFGDNCAGSIALGEKKTCIVTNDDIAPQLTIIKHVINDNGGTAVAADFVFNVTGNNVSSSTVGGVEDPGTTITLNAGQYSVVEQNVPGYAITLATAGCISSIAVGEHKTCEIHNNDIAPSLTLVKEVVGQGSAASWTLTAAGPTGFSGVGPSVSNGVSFDAGTYNLSENGPSGYLASDWVCVGGTQNDADTITLGLGEDATCTITNTEILPLRVGKTAETSYTRTHNWTIDKSVTPAVWNLFEGDSGTSEYTVAVDKTGFTDTNHTVTGVITINNPNTHSDLDATIESVTDVLDVTGAVSVDCDVEFPYVLQNGTQLECTYTSAADPDDTLNTATVTTSGLIPGGNGIAFVEYGAPTTVVNDSIDVADSNGMNWNFNSDATVSYDAEFSCDSDEGEHNNTVTIAQTSATDSASVEVNCFALSVTKNANTSYDKTFAWTINKVGDQETLTLSPGQSYPVNYDVTVDADAGTDSNWAVEGVITVNNPAPVAATVNSVADIVGAAGAAAVVCPGDAPYTIAAGESLVCSYTKTLENASALVNTATATQQNYSYAANGIPTPAGTTNESGNANVDFANATITKVDECITVNDTNSNGPQGQVVCEDQAPKTFEYTVEVGNYGAELCGTVQQFDNTASFVTNDSQTAGSDIWSVDTSVRCVCSLTQGFWKTHSDQGPAPFYASWNKLGDVDGDTILEQESEKFFLSNLTWLQTFKTPVAGNMYYQLAHQYMAAKLNVLNGAAAPAPVLAALAQAESYFGTYTPAQIGALKGKNKTTLTANFTTFAGTLGAFNEGLTNAAGHCSEIPTP